MLKSKLKAKHLQTCTLQHMIMASLPLGYTQLPKPEQLPDSHQKGKGNQSLQQQVGCVSDINLQGAAKAQRAAHALFWLDLPSCQGHPA